MPQVSLNRENEVKLVFPPALESIATEFNKNYPKNCGTWIVDKDLSGNDILRLDFPEASLEKLKMIRDLLNDSIFNIAYSGSSKLKEGEKGVDISTVKISDDGEVVETKCIAISPRRIKEINLKFLNLHIENRQSSIDYIFRHTERAYRSFAEFKFIKGDETKLRSYYRDYLTKNYLEIDKDILFLLSNSFDYPVNSDTGQRFFSNQQIEKRFLEKEKLLKFQAEAMINTNTVITEFLEPKLLTYLDILEKFEAESDNGNRLKNELREIIIKKGGKRSVEYLNSLSQDIKENPTYIFSAIQTKNLLNLTPINKEELNEDFKCVPSIPNDRKISMNKTYLFFVEDSLGGNLTQHLEDTMRVAHGTLKKLTGEENGSKSYEIIGLRNSTTPGLLPSSMLALLDLSQNTRLVFSNSCGMDEFSMLGIENRKKFAVDKFNKNFEEDLKYWNNKRTLNFESVGNSAISYQEPSGYLHSNLGISVGAAYQEEGKIISPNYSGNNPLFSSLLPLSNGKRYEGTSFANPGAAAVASFLTSKYGVSENNKFGLIPEEIIYVMSFSARKDEVYFEFDKGNKATFYSNKAGMNYNPKAGFGVVDPIMADLKAKELLDIKIKGEIITKPKLLEVVIDIDNVRKVDEKVTHYTYKVQIPEEVVVFKIFFNTRYKESEIKSASSDSIILTDSKNTNFSYLHDCTGKYSLFNYLGAPFKKGDYFELKTETPLKEGSLYIYGVNVDGGIGMLSK